MDLEQKLYNPESDEWKTIREIISILCECGNCTNTDMAMNHIEYSLKHGILVDHDTYRRKFAPYEN